MRFRGRYKGGRMCATTIPELVGEGALALIPDTKQRGRMEYVADCLTSAFVGQTKCTALICKPSTGFEALIGDKMETI